MTIPTEAARTILPSPQQVIRFLWKGRRHNPGPAGQAAGAFGQKFHRRALDNLEREP
jgi:hypothetical protein